MTLQSEVPIHYRNGHTDKLASLHQSARAAEDAFDWQVAALKYQEILQLDADSEVALNRLDDIRRKLAEVAIEAIGVYEIDDALVLRLRMYNYVRSAVHRAMKRSDKHRKGKN